MSFYKPDYECMRINLYICKIIYNKMKKYRSQKFNGYRAHDVFGINEKRQLRIFQCQRGTKLSDEEIENIAKNMFNIPSEYFKVGSDSMIKVGIERDDWTNRLDKIYNTTGVQYTNPQVKMIRDEINQKIEDIVRKSNDKGAVGDILYNICYYYRHGEANLETIENRIGQIAGSLNEVKKNILKIKDLDDVEKNITSMEKSIKIIREVLDLKKEKVL